MNNFDMPTQLDVINFHNTHDTLCVPKGMTLKQLVEDYDKIKKSLNEQIEDLQQKVEQQEKEIERLNNIIDKQDRDITTLTKDKIKLKNMINGDDKSVKD